MEEEIKLGVVDMTVDGAGAVIAQTYGYKKITATTPIFQCILRTISST